MHNLPDGFDVYLINVKTIRKIAQIFVAFSEKLNFNQFTSRNLIIEFNFFDLQTIKALFNEKM